MIDFSLDINSILANIGRIILNKISVPTEFHQQCSKIATMKRDDPSGLICSLTDFQVASAITNFEIITTSGALNETLNHNWLENINLAYLGKIPKGLKALQEEYYKERWGGSSFIVLKLFDWQEIGGILLPTRMYFINGASIYTKKKNKKNNVNEDLLGYDYYLDEQHKHKLDKGVIFQKPFGRWFDEYEIPYYFRRGIYHNWEMINMLKVKQGMLLEQVIPFLLKIAKGDQQAIREGKQKINPEDLEKLAEDIQKDYDKTKESSEARAFTRFTLPDEVWEHIIPDIAKMFANDVPAGMERNILGGFGFIEMENVLSTSRKEGVLNPKVFIEEVNKGSGDFGKILSSIIDAVIIANSERPKYVEKLSKAIIHRPKARPFMTDAFKQELRLMFLYGALSYQTYIEVVGETDAEVERIRRERELHRGDEILFYPHQNRNLEEQTSQEEQAHLGKMGKEELLDENGNPLPPDKTDEALKDNYAVSGLAKTLAPYNSVSDLSPKIRKHLSADAQKTFIDVFNSSYKKHQDEVRAIRSAWKVIKLYYKKNKKGIWVRKNKKVTAEEIRTIANQLMEENDYSEDLSEQIKVKQNKQVDKEE